MIHRVHKGVDGNLIILDITVEGSRLTLTNIYGPNSDEPNFDNVLFE